MSLNWSLMGASREVMLTDGKPTLSRGADTQLRCATLAEADRKGQQKTNVIDQRSADEAKRGGSDGAAKEWNESELAAAPSPKDSTFDAHGTLIRCHCCCSAQ